VTEESRQKAMDQVFAIYDPARNGIIEMEAFVNFYNEGKKLPDFNWGPGHHGDMEYEYEIHEDDTEEDLTHPEDIEHFKKHREAEALQLKLEKLEQMSIVEANIPAKFFRHV
jgi:hypothetical protein